MGYMSESEGNAPILGRNCSGRDKGDSAERLQRMDCKDGREMSIGGKGRGEEC